VRLSSFPEEVPAGAVKSGNLAWKMLGETG
jgi:hypothetical protein